MLEKPKRPNKINNQDNKQPQTIQDLIRRYDLDNTKVYDFLDNLVNYLNKTEYPKYSTEEQVVGEWIDGKPLYRKTIHLTSGWIIGNEATINHNIQNIDKIVKYEAFYLRSDNNTHQVPNLHTEATWRVSIYDMTPSNFKCHVGHLGNVHTIQFFDVTFYYTKITD